MKNHYLSLIWYKAYADLRVEAARGYLGILWWILEPLLYMLVFYIVFGVLLNRGGGEFVSFLLCGLVIWRWFDNTIRKGCGAIQANAALMWQVYLPKYLFPSVVVIENGVKFAIVLFILLGYLTVAGPGITEKWLALPVLLLVQLFLITSCTIFVAAIIPIIPDLRLLIENGLTLLFFMSGIFFDLSTLSPEIRSYFLLNPMAGLISGYRAVLLHNEWPHWNMLVVITLASSVLLLIAWVVINRFDRIYPKISSL